MKEYKDKIKLINLLYDVLYQLKTAKLKSIQARFTDLGTKYSELTKNSALFDTTINKGWFSSADSIRSRISRSLYEFKHNLQQFTDVINSDDPQLQKSSDIFADILQLEQEFGQIDIDLEARTLSVTTESIVLDDVSFGPFEIKLYLDQIEKLYTGSPYRIIALDPNPAATDENVTHPHVTSERLCEGDGCIPIRKALEQGRMCDFFHIIKGILDTYNPDSPYVSIDDWSGVSCYDCGRTIVLDESYYCESCYNSYCESCSTYCHKCDNTICLACSYACPACGEPVCSRCTATCSECGEIFCEDCVIEGICQTCEDFRKEQEYEEEQETIPAPLPAVQPDSMGKIIIHEG